MHLIVEALEIDIKDGRLSHMSTSVVHVAEHEVTDALTLMASLGNLVGQAVQDARYSEPILEAAFQNDVRQFLRQSRHVGVQLEEQAHSAGGRADLSFRGIRIELKSNRERPLVPSDCKQYAEQAASYGIGTNRRLTFLCVLDCSPKARLAFPMEDGIFVEQVDTPTTPVFVITCLIQGGLPKPSSLSK